MFDNFFMDEALKQAKLAYRKGEVPVGAVIVSNIDNKIIAKAHNMVELGKNSCFHAEILAIKKACRTLNSKYLINCNIYSTLEPCIMCAGAIAHAKISSLFYGAADIKHGSVENGCRFFTSKNCFHKPEIYPGLQSTKAQKLIITFFRKQVRGNN